MFLPSVNHPFQFLSYHLDIVCLQKYKMAAKINLKADKIVMVITVAMFL